MSKHSLDSELITCMTCRSFSVPSYDLTMMALHALSCEVEVLEPLAVLLEAELLLMERWAEQHGCGCSRHRSWKVTS